MGCFYDIWHALVYKIYVCYLWLHDLAMLSLVTSQKGKTSGLYIIFGLALLSLVIAEKEKLCMLSLVAQSPSIKKRGDLQNPLWLPSMRNLYRFYTSLVIGVVLTW